MEVTLQTDVEAGASGYSVTGGGKEGIFVKQVLKDSSAAKLFSLREGDQLLSATIYFDNIKYEDALKILQYSEPYKVQFNLKRKLSLKDDTEKVHRPATSDIREADQQGEGLTDGTMETSEKTLEEEDKEKLIVKPRTGRSQRPKKERLSWPKFQAKKTKKVVSHRRSHSTSDACEGRAPDLSPTSTDTELHIPKEETYLKEKKDSGRKRKFLNIGFRMNRKPETDDKILKAGPKIAEARTKIAKESQRILLDIQDPEMELDRAESQGIAGIPEYLESGDNRLKLQLHGDPRTKKQEDMASDSGAEIGIPTSVSGTFTGPHVSLRGRRKKLDYTADTTKDTVSGRKYASQTGKETRERLEDASFGVRGLEIGIAKLTLQEPQEELGKGYETPEIRVKIPTLQTPKFGFSKGKVPEAKVSLSGHEWEQSLGSINVNQGEIYMEAKAEKDVSLPDVTEAMRKISVETPSLDHTSYSISEISDWKVETPSMKISQISKMDASIPKVDITIPSTDVSLPKFGVEGSGTGIEGVKMEGDIKMGDKDMEGKDSKFKMPKFKMPSFGWSPGKEKKGSVEVSLPKRDVDVPKASIKKGDKGDLRISLTPAEIPGIDKDFTMKKNEKEVNVDDGGMGIKEPNVQMPSIKVPQELKGDTKGPKIDVTIPSMDISLPKVELKKQDTRKESERVNLAGEVTMREKESDHKESKFKMPRFSMPGFGWGVSKDIGSSVDSESTIKQPKMTVMSHTEEKSTTNKKQPGFDINVEIKEGKMEKVNIKEIEIDKQIKVGEIESRDEKGTHGSMGIKQHMPKMQIPGMKIPQMPKADIKGPKVDITMPSMDGSLPQGKVDIKSPDLEVEGVKLEGDIKLGDKDAEGKDSKFKMPKFKMPSFGVSVPSKEGSASVDVSLPKADVDVALPSVKGEVKAGDLSVELPSVEVDVKGVAIEAHVPEAEAELGDLKGKAGSAGIKGHLPKVHMPSIKMPQLPKADIKGPKVDVTMPSVDVSLPKGKVDIKSPDLEVEGVKLEGDIKLGDKDAEGKDSKFKMPKFKMPSFGISSPSKKIVTPGAVSLPKGDVVKSLSSSKCQVKVGDLNMDVEVPSVPIDTEVLLDSDSFVPEEEVQFGVLQVTSDTSNIKDHLPEVQFAGIKVPQISKCDPNVPMADIITPTFDFSQSKDLVNITVPEIDVAAVSVEGDRTLVEKEFDGKQSKFKIPKFKMPSFGSSHRKISKSSVDTHMPPADIEFSETSTECTVKEPDLSSSSFQGASVLKDPNSKIETSKLKLQMPKLTLPSLGFSKGDGKISKTSVNLGVCQPEVLSSTVDASLPTIPATVDRTSVEAPCFDIPVLETDTQNIVSKVPVSSVTVPKSDSQCPQFEGSLQAINVKNFSVKPDSEASISEPGTLEMDQDMNLAFSSSSDTHERHMHFPGVMLPGLTSTKINISGHHTESAKTIVKEDITLTKYQVTLPMSESHDATSLPHSDTFNILEGHSLCLKGEGEELEVSADIENERVQALPYTPAGVIKFPRFHKPKFGVSVSKPLDISYSQEPHKVAADVMAHEVPLAPATDGRKEEEIPTEGQESWFKMPKFRMPSFGRSSSKEKKVVLDTEVVPVVVPAALTQSEIQVPEGPDLGKATAQEPSVDKGSGKDQTALPDVHMPELGSLVAQAKSHNIHISIPKLEANVSQPSPKADIGLVALETETYADVLKRNIDDKGLKLCQPTAGILDSTISVSEVRVPSGENSVSVLMPSLRFSTSEMKADGTVGFSKPEMYLPPTEGPIKFKASSTEIPSQVSVIETGRVWEGSVLTVKFPKLQVPKFTFQAPSTESDIFIPQVREIACPETDIEIAVHKESPEEWSAKVLKAVSEVPPQPSPDPVRPPKDLALTSIASPISKVKVHIQGAHIESQEVTVESRVTCEHGELPRRETFSTQIVRASEIPPSGIQTPSYGFSLLKVKIPESHINLDVSGKEPETLRYTSSAFKMQDTSEESLRKDESGVDTVDLSLEGELQPETGEPYEIISSSANLPKLKTFTFEVHSSHQYVDSYSDEEPAEILEFPPEDTHGQTPPDEEEKEQKVQLESKKSSGLFRFWLPNIGFSSSTDASNSDSKAEVSKSVPIETQPEARSDIELPKKSEKTGWFRFPKLGFSSSPAKKSEAEESEAEPTKAGSQEEAEQTVTFFDAQETLSPEDKEGSEAITSTNKDDIQDTSALITSSARTELILLEQEGKTTGRTVSGPVAK